jgi:hypothetical protein
MKADLGRVPTAFSAACQTATRAVKTVMPAAAETDCPTENSAHSEQSLQILKLPDRYYRKDRQDAQNLSLRFDRTADALGRGKLTVPAAGNYGF